MRAHRVSATSVRIVMTVLGFAATSQAKAQDAVHAARGLAPAGQTLRAAPLPASQDPSRDRGAPFADPSVPRPDVTGSLGQPTPDGAAKPSVAGRGPSPALPLDDEAASMAVEPFGLNPRRPDAGKPVITATVTPSGPATPSAGMGTPAPVLPFDAVVVPPVPSPALSLAPHPTTGLDEVALGAAMTAFAAERLEGNPARVAERHRIRDAIAAFYAGRANAPLWIAGDHLSDGARAVLARLDHASEDGLDLRPFAVPMPRSTETGALARAELALSEASVAYGRQATGARVDVSKLGGLIDMRPDVADVARVLGTVPGSADAGATLAAFNPSHPGYLALRQKLAELRQRFVPEAQSRISAGPVLKLGMSDARVPLIRARFGLDLAADTAEPALVYDTRVAAAVADFQRTNGLPASGALTARTVAALSGGETVRLENTIVANMEQWRWLPRDLGPDHIEVNIPDFTAQVLRSGAVVEKTRVVVGQPDKPTPVFSQEMRFVIVNPYWNVPLSIIGREMMPKLAADPQYFQNHGYEVIERDGTTFVRQPPGEGNALGRIKFMFPNSHSVYLHDTNARSFFGRDKRALSHGCVRVENPFRFAEAVLGRSNGWSEARVKAMVGGAERTINLPQPLPIHILYFTAFVDPQKGLQVRDDVYGYSGRVKTALGLN